MSPVSTEERRWRARPSITVVGVLFTAALLEAWLSDLWLHRGRRASVAGGTIPEVLIEREREGEGEQQRAEEQNVQTTMNTQLPSLLPPCTSTLLRGFVFQSRDLATFQRCRCSLPDPGGWTKKTHLWLCSSPWPTSPGSSSELLGEQESGSAPTAAPPCGEYSDTSGLRTDEGGAALTAAH